MTDLTVISGKWHVPTQTSCPCDAIAEAFSAAASTQGGLLVQDNSFEEYEQIPVWILEGYSTLLTEVNQQLSEKGLDTATLMVSPALGPCGAATLAALWKLRDAEDIQPRCFLSEEAVVVLLGTEGQREYQVPIPISNVGAVTAEV
ncbi:hypothetical protein CHGG_09239 [Chaetomium globosum CBS 148.51]|uniref:Tryptophan synthase beta chain-like PALP domain-containing protein n=1 Tax=Chaetomium globosum (strain ATCC 6205 / CBS 148.51 / DSM 1962 / NBRC 6347 / NRRL 1970) TaxID=306901 RepID=Q2GS15_CHAGB|nr:uncharacterized protein CHGG_09239 [Chaetomium globosum CBS 148.51]EAQ85225.1 hypothetical protein CHGG_09239 [Chaetomium globosum CBS 148.51]